MEKTIFLLIFLLSLARAQDSLLFSYLNQPYAQMVTQFSQADSFRTTADNKEIAVLWEGGKMTLRLEEGHVFETRYQKKYSVKSDCDTIYDKIMRYFYNHEFSQMYFYRDEENTTVITYARDGVACRLGIKKMKNEFILNFVLKTMKDNPLDYLYSWPDDFLRDDE